jgi:hypothetical protein
MKIDLKFLKRCADFCRAHGAPHFYKDWSALVLLEYLNFHAQRGTLAAVESADGFESICGLGVAYRMDAARVRELAAAHKPMFDWSAAENGDSIFVGHVVCTERGSIARLVAVLMARFPEWRELKIFTQRHLRAGGHELREYPAKILERLTTKAQRHQELTAA